MAAFPPQDMVLVAPTLSRCLYAQLALQEFAPPRGYPLPLPSDAQARAGMGTAGLLCGYRGGSDSVVGCGAGWVGGQGGASCLALPASVDPASLSSQLAPPSLHLHTVQGSRTGAEAHCRV